MTFKISKPLSLRMQLTLMTALLTTVICFVLSAYISTTAVLSMDKIENSVIAVLPLDAFKSSNDATYNESQNELSGNANSTSLFSSDISSGLNDNESTADSNTSDTTCSQDVFPDSPVETSGLYLDIQGDLSAEIQNTRSLFWTKSLLATLFIVIASSLLVYLLMGYALKPLAEFTECVEKISDQNIEDTITVPHASKELLRLTDVFNAMMKRLGRAFTMQRQFTGNAAHELRTPLAVMQTKLDLYHKQDVHSGKEYEDIIEMCGTQTARLSHVVNLLLEMTQLQGAQRADHISLSALIEEVLCDLTPVAEERNITLVQNEGDAQIIGNDTLIYRAVYNLIENAIKYNRDGGSVTISVTSNADDAIINITDTGRGIAEEDRDKIFEPFYRVDKSRSRNASDSQNEAGHTGGAGLGLALVKEIATEHGGDVYVADSSESGTRISFKIRK